MWWLIAVIILLIFLKKSGYAKIGDIGRLGGAGSVGTAGDANKVGVSGMRAMNPIPYDWDIKKEPIITTNNVDLSLLLEQVVPAGFNGRSFMSPAI